VGVAVSTGGVANFLLLQNLCRLETTFEPIFAELALYDAKERKKVIKYY